MAQDSAAGRRRITGVLVAVVVLSLVAVVTWLAVGRSDDASGTPAAAGETRTSTSPSGEHSSATTKKPTTTKKPSTTKRGSATAAPHTPAPSTATGAAEAAGLPAELPAVAPTATARGDDGVLVRIEKIEHVNGQAVAAGEISGPAVRMTIAVTNKTSKPLDLGYVVVNAYTGAKRSPAGTVMAPGGVPFGGTLKASETATGVLLFTIPTAQRGDVTVTVDYRFGQPTVVFHGSVR